MKTYDFPGLVIPAAQAQNEQPAAYGARILRHLLEHDSYAFVDVDGLELAAAMARSVYGPETLPAAADRIGDVARKIGETLKARRAAVQALETKFNAEFPPVAENAGQDGQAGADGFDSLSKEAQIATMLKALLALVSGPDDGGPGKGARLIKPTPKLPPGGVAIQTPGTGRPF